MYLFYFCQCHTSFSTIHNPHFAKPELVYSRKFLALIRRCQLFCVVSSWMFSLRLLQFFFYRWDLKTCTRTHAHADQTRQVNILESIFRKEQKLHTKLHLGEREREREKRTNAEWIWTPDRIETNQMKRNANKNFQCHNETQGIGQRKKSEGAGDEAYWIFISWAIVDAPMFHGGLFVVAITAAIVDSIHAKMSTLSTFISPIDWVIASGRRCCSVSTLLSLSSSPSSMSSPSPSLPLCIHQDISNDNET